MDPAVFQVQSFQLKATALEDAVADHVMGHERRRRSSLDVASAARRLFTSTSSTDGRARQSSDQLQQMQVGVGGGTGVEQEVACWVDGVAEHVLVRVWAVEGVGR